MVDATHVAQFRALAYKNLSLQLKRKGSTCCQLFIPISIALVVGLMQLLTAYESPSGNNKPDIIYPSAEWNVPGVSTYLNNITYSTPTMPDSLALGTCDPFGSHTNSGLMGLCPQGQYTQYNSYQSMRTPFLGRAQTPDQIDQYFYDRLTEVQQCEYNCYGFNLYDANGAILFKDMQISPEINLDYTVQPGNEVYLRTMYTGADARFLVSFVHNSIYRFLRNNTESLLAVGFSPMPYVEYDSNSIVGNIFSLFMIPFAASFLFSVYMYTLVQEKKEGLVQKMHSCGLSMATYWIVNYIYNYLLFLLISSVLFAFGVGFKVEVFVKKPLEMIILLFLYGHAQVAMCQFLTCFIWTPTLAAIVGFLLSLFGALTGMALEFFLFLQSPLQMPDWYYLLYPGIAFYHGFGLLLYQLMDPTFPKVTLMPGTHFSNILLILILETVVLFLLTWYIEAVFPRQVGIRRHPLFPFHALYNKYKSSRSYNLLPEQDEGRVLLEELPEKNINGDTEDEDVAREREMARSSDSLVRIIELTKIYSGTNGKADKLALNHLSLRIQANECFGLLGPNGAGKTTLISTLCGTIPPSSGIAYIDGLNIKKDMQAIHKIIGICPQFDVLWPELTVTEHLLFYLRLKAASKSNEQAHVKEIIEEVGLEEVANRAANGLSGGQKRRLSIAIAMMGRPKLILMDEPTTGLDPSSRRALWDIIVKAKERHSIVLSTHSMEEAEVLCNRIGIMRKAQLHSVGTQMQLKNKFELGYNIKISHFLNCEDKAHSFVMEAIPNAVLVRAFGGMRAYKVMKGDFVLSDLFKRMELNKFRYGIKEWSISQASLEEVFLAIVTEDEGDAQ